ncbi:MAG: phosphopyruvate hydratase [Clostridia bacterium]|nr:phosphopyruvate hydratase [Clostridia bacterium]
MDEKCLRIAGVKAEEILDCRGNPTVRTTVTLEGGITASASVPSGASTGSHEAAELRDGDENRYGGLGVLQAVENVNSKIAPVILGVCSCDQTRIDSLMIALDGTKNRSKLGANATLSVSLAVCAAAARGKREPLYRYLGGTFTDVLPIPMMNLINGGAHAGNNLDVQEFMLVPIGAPTFADALRCGAETAHSLKKILKEQGHSTAVGDEGGFAPNLENDEEAISLLLRAAEINGYRPGKDVAVSLDVAASAWVRKNSYVQTKSKQKFTKSALAEHYRKLTSEFPILSIEDGMGEDDREGWRILSEKVGKSCLLVGDDLFVTNPDRIREGAAANALLVKPNQIGTLTETVEAIRLARQRGMKIILSHRSGETEDATLADLAVGLGADFIKSGAPIRGERTAKYNRLLSIERELFRPEYGSFFS